MADIDKRLHYFNGQFLQDVDFNAEQAYHLERQRRHNRVMHTFGIAEGLTVTAPQGVNSITVSPGTALDGLGQQIVLTQGDTRTLQLNQQAFLGKTVLVVISYAEATSDQATVGGSGNTRWQERPNVQLVIDDANAPPPDTSLRLARLTLNSSGATTGAADLSVRVSAGVKLGTDVPIQTLRLSNPNLASGLWPVFTSGAANRADLTGNLNVSGTATVGGIATIVGAATLQGGALIMSNANVVGPATVTGVANLQSGAVITGAASISTNLTVGGTATVTGPVNGRMIAADGTKLDNHVAIVAGNPHGTTAAQVGAPVSVAGVLNPGADIGLVGSGGITVTPDNSSNKRITLSTSPQAIGALPLASYDLGNRYLASVAFTNADANGATRTATIGFQPKLVIVHSSGQAPFGVTAGGLSNGFADLRGSILQSSIGIYYVRYSAGSNPQFTTWGTPGLNGPSVANFYFYDYGVTPNAQNNLDIAITAVSSTGLTLTLSRTTFSQTFSSFSVTLQLLCLG
jgi:hypothetical protein